MAPFFTGTDSVPEVILFHPSENTWVLPLNPFKRLDGELSVQVDRRVAVTLHVWGQYRGDHTPRMEKWLKILFSTLIEMRPDLGRC